MHAVNTSMNNRMYSSRSGQVALLFVIMLPVMVILIAWMLNLSLAYITRIKLQSAANIAVRDASIFMRSEIHEAAVQDYYRALEYNRRNPENQIPIHEDSAVANLTDAHERYYMSQSFYDQQVAQVISDSIALNADSEHLKLLALPEITNAQFRTMGSLRQSNTCGGGTTGLSVIIELSTGITGVGTGSGALFNKIIKVESNEYTGYC